MFEKEKNSYRLAVGMIVSLILVCVIYGQSSDQGGGDTTPFVPTPENAFIVTTTNSVTFASGTSVNMYNESFQVGALTSTTPLYLNLTNQNYQTVSLTNDVTFATTNRAAGRMVSLKILAVGGDRALTFPAWKFLGSAAPTNITSGKTAILSVTLFGASETNGVAAYAVEP